MSSFGPVAPYYDELMEGVPYRMWVGYYLLLLSHLGVHPKRLLDVCCGTGTLTELLLEEGFQPEGFDLSEGMIAEARRKAEALGLPLRYECLDAAEFDMGHTYEGAYSFFDSLNYITEPERLQMALKRVAAHLEPGGSFIFDLNTKYAFEARLFDQQRLSPTASIRYKWVGDWNSETRLISVDMRFWRGEEEFHEVHVQRAYADDEVRSMLANAGFEYVRCFHSYSLNPPRFKSDRVHYVAVMP